jgi:hypothetical protein
MNLTISKLIRMQCIDITDRTIKDEYFLSLATMPDELISITQNVFESILNSLGAEPINKEQINTEQIIDDTFLPYSLSTNSIEQV